MGRHFSSGYDIAYDVFDEGGEEVMSMNDESCFSELTDYFEGFVDVYEVKLENVLCEQTRDYYEFYLNYLIKAFKLKHTNIGASTFSFCVYTDAKGKRRMTELELLTVLTCVRYLWEGNAIAGMLKFFKYLKKDYDKTGKANLQTIMKAWGESNQQYVNKIHQFCSTDEIIPKTLGALRKWKGDLNGFCTHNPKKQKQQEPDNVVRFYVQYG